MDFGHVGALIERTRRQGVGPLVRTLVRVAGQTVRPYLTSRDPLVPVAVGARTILMPRSHRFPVHQIANPDYSTNLVRVAEALVKKYPDLVAVDIGANVGDSIALLRSIVHFPILAIEGEDRFFEVLQTNVPALGGDVDLEKAFVGAQSGKVPAAVASERGTARLSTTTDAGGGIAITSLTDVLVRHPAFARAKLLKIDTDGYDVEILRANMDWLCQVQPVIFFEYDPYLLDASDTPDPVAIFAELADAGYGRALAYENTGDFLCSLACRDVRLAEELHSYFSGRKSRRYLDVSAFPQEDEDVCERLRVAEMRYFERRRG